MKSSSRTRSPAPALRMTAVAALALAALALGACGGEESDNGSTATPEELGLTTDALVADGKVQDPTAAIDPRSGTIYVAWAERVGGKGSAEHEHHGGGASSDEAELHIHLARSSDGGETFSPPTLVSEPGGNVSAHSGGPPQVAVGLDGAVYVAWQRNVPHPDNEFGRSDVMFARSDDRGKRFGRPHRVVTDEGVVSTNFHNLFVAADGQIHMGWLDYRHAFGAGARGYEPVQVRVSRSDDRGETFSKSTLVDELACECCRVDFALDENELLLGWRQIFPRGELAAGQDPADGRTPVRDVVIARSTDGGQRWSGPEKIHDDGWVVAQCPHTGPAMDVDAQGELHAAWYTGQQDGPGVYYAPEDGEAGGFGEPRELFAGTSNPASVVSLETDDEEHIWIAWDTAGREEPQAWLARASSDGDGEPVTSELGPGIVPRVATGAGRLVVVWADGKLIRTLSGRAGA